MEQLKIPFQDLYNHPLFAGPEEKQELDAIFKKCGKLDNHQNSSKSDQLIISAFEDLQTSEENASHFLERHADEILNSNPKKMDLVTTNAIGVKILTKTLGNMHHSASTSKYDQQLWLEERAHSAAQEEAEQMQKKLPDSIKNIAHIPSSMVLEWHKSLVFAISDMLKDLEKNLPKANAKDTDFFPFLKLLPVEMLSRITISEFLKLDHSRAQETDIENAAAKKAVRVMEGIGRSIEREYNLQQLKKKKTIAFVSLIHC
jgi:hypothetical protein